MNCEDMDEKLLIELNINTVPNNNEEAERSVEEKINIRINKECKIKKNWELYNIR
jgi:hypothetical protein